MRYLICVLLACLINFGCATYAIDNCDMPQEKNVLHATRVTQEAGKSSQDEKNVISDSSDDRDEDTFIKSSENPLNDDAFDFDLQPEPDEIRNL